jgi:hypothetical protein
MDLTGAAKRKTAGSIPGKTTKKGRAGGWASPSRDSGKPAERKAGGGDDRAVGRGAGRTKS